MVALEHSKSVGYRELKELRGVFGGNRQEVSVVKSPSRRGYAGVGSFEFKVQVTMAKDEIS